jgi:fructokinase
MTSDDGGTIEVAVFGEMLVDEFPERSVLGGAPLNVAVHLRRFGLDPVLYSRVGEDDAGDRLLDLVADAGLDARGIQRDARRPTGTVRVHVGDAGHRFEILDDQAYDHVDADAVAALAPRTHPRLVYFGTLAQRAAESRAALDALLETTDCPRWLDINLREPWYDRDVVVRSLEAATIVKLNDVELDVVSAMLGLTGVDAETRAAALLAAYGLDAAVVTCGERGAWSLRADGTLTRASGGPLDGPLADTVGAGDGFAAVSVLGLLRDWPDAVRLARADAFARAICGVRGAIPPDESFYRPFLEAWG